LKAKEFARSGFCRLFEGARSVTGPFLATLGATGAIVGVVAGLGELLGYALRVVSGRVSERTQLF